MKKNKMIIVYASRHAGRSLTRMEQSIPPLTPLAGLKKFWTSFCRRRVEAAACGDNCQGVSSSRLARKSFAMVAAGSNPTSPRRQMAAANFAGPASGISGGEKFPIRVTTPSSSSESQPKIILNFSLCLLIFSALQHLPLNQIPEHPRLPYQRIISSILHDLPIRDHQNSIAILHRRQPMRDN